jgi:hypothetical protein
MIWIIGSTLFVVVAGVLIAKRSRRAVDLGFVSTSWTTEHNAADRGNDRSNG